MRRFWVAVCGLVGLLPGQEISADVTTVQVERGTRVTGNLAEDLNGDGLLDLVLVTYERGDGEYGSGQRYLQVHLQRAGTPPFANRPERPRWRLPANVVAFAVADVASAPGAELVLFSPDLAVALFWNKGETEPAVERLTGMSLLWQPAHRIGIVSWQAGVRDLDGDGLVDLVLPEPQGYRIAFQRRGDDGTVDFERVERLKLPPGPPVVDRRQQRVELTLSFGVGAAGNPWLLRVNDLVPAPQLADWDGDGDLDVIALREDVLLVWTLDGEHGFGLPARHLLQVQERTDFDPAYIARAVDVNGDRRADVVLGSSRTRDNEVTSTIAVYVQEGDDPWDSPSDRLRFRGFAGLMDLEDLDGDGMPELVVGSIRTDLINALTVGDGQLDTQLNVLRNGYAGRAGGFERPVALVHSMSVRASLDSDRVTAMFFGDCDGNGLQDLLVRDGRRRIQVLLMRKSGSELVLSEPVWEMQIENGAQVRRLEGAARPSLLIVEGDQVVHVRIR